MAKTQLTGRQIGDGSVQRPDLDVSTAGAAVIAKVLAGGGIGLTSTGPDAGTGDVTIGLSAKVSRLYPEQLTVTAANTLSPLSFSYIGPFAIMFVNGVVYTDFGTPAFTISGTTITWNATNAAYSLSTTDVVKIIYNASI